MKNTYCKCLLYAYPNVEQLLDQLDTLAEKKVLASMDDFTPCLEQCEKILSITEQKDVLIMIKLKTEQILSGLTYEELDLLDYKYFKQKPKEYYSDYDCSSRAYFRKQNKVLDKMSLLFEKAGFTDEWFTKECLKNDFFVRLYAGVREREDSVKKESVKRQKPKPISYAQSTYENVQKSCSLSA